MDKLYVCQACGHIEFGGAPESCPTCGAPKHQFKEDANALMSAEKEGQEKHAPQIVVTDDCGLIPGVCRDIHVKVGTVPHPMQADHWIQWIDVYVNKTFAARYSLLPQTMQPAVGVHLTKSQKGTLSVIEHCNKHGSWIAEASL